LWATAFAPLREGPSGPVTTPLAPLGFTLEIGIAIARLLFLLQPIGKELQVDIFGQVTHGHLGL
jgi:hypothetical protein